MLLKFHAHPFVCVLCVRGAGVRGHSAAPRRPPREQEAGAGGARRPAGARHVQGGALRGHRGGGARPPVPVRPAPPLLGRRVRDVPHPDGQPGRRDQPQDPLHTEQVPAHQRGVARGCGRAPLQPQGRRELREAQRAPLRVPRQDDAGVWRRDRHQQREHTAARSESQDSASYLW